MNSKANCAYFSISSHLLPTDSRAVFSIYINSSGLDERKRFIKVIRRGTLLTKCLIDEVVKKYFRIYIKESDRQVYLDSLITQENIGKKEKIKVIKNSTLKYLESIFSNNEEINYTYIGDNINNCKKAVENMLTIINDSSIRKIYDLIGDLGFHDFYTYDHSINVCLYNMMILKEIDPNIDRSSLVSIGLGGLLHDLGKLKIPTNIINYPGELLKKDFELIKKHPVYGKELLLKSLTDLPNDVDWEIIERIIMEHHENYNGSGYPNGLGGEEIHYYARITAISDFFDAITTKRAYHDILPIDQALAVMKRSAGKKIDPILIDIFVKAIGIDEYINKNVHQLDDNYDPCQPHNVLPLIKSKPKIFKKDIFNSSSKKKAS